MKLIQGSGGGGKGGGGSAVTASEAANSLKSRADAQILDLICEGEIEGLVNGLGSVYLDGTPIQNTDGSYNFSGVTIVTRNGTQDQTYIPGFADSESETNVNTEVRAGVPVTRTITDSNVNAVRIGISIPQLTYQNPSTGDLSGSQVEYAIDLQSNGGGFQEIIRDLIIGKCVSKYERKYRIELTGSPPWDIRVRRITADSTTITTQNKTTFDSYTTIIDGKLKYPNSALVGLKIDSSQFSSIPTRGYDIKGTRVKVPVNYNPNTRKYTGSWDGRFYIAWTDNPAWIFYDLITSTRYGLGKFIPETSVDKWSLYTIAKYCDELVPDGKGGSEPRFTCNVYIQTREEAFKVIQDFASCFRAMVFWVNGAISTVQDSPADPAFLFSPSNVVDGLFTYQGSSAKTRHTVALVTWNDPDDFYTQKIEYVENSEAVAKYGIIETQIVAFGCTSRGQANRVGRWLLYTEQYQSETIAFKAGLEGTGCRPGQIIKVADPVRAGLRLAGRIKDSTYNSITLDQSVSIDPDKYTLSVVLPNGKTEDRKLQSSIGNLVTVQVPFSVVPSSPSMWMLASNEVQPQLFKIISVSEAGNGIYDISAIAHDPNKYDYVEKGLVLQPRSISALDITPSAPLNLTITETLYQVSAEIRVKITFSWNTVIGASSYIVQYARENSNAITIPQTSSNDVEVLNAEAGTYTVTVWAVSPLGKVSQASTVTKKIFGKSIPPGNVQGFSLIPTNGSAYLTWNKSSDLNVLQGGTVRIRYTPDTVSPVWKNSVDILEALAGGSVSAIAPLLPGTYMAKFVSSSNIPSPTEAIIVTTIPAAVALNVVRTITESPAFAGVRSNMDISSFFGGLTLAAALKIDDVTDNIDSLINFDFAGGVANNGTYDFANVVDLTQVFTSRVTVGIRAEAVDVADTVDQRAENVDDWLDVDGSNIDDVNAEVWMKTTLDDPASGTANWTDWKKFFVGEYVARGFKFQLRASSLGPSHNIVVKDLSVTVDMPDREFKQQYTTTPAAFNVVYDNPFAANPLIGITALNMVAGDRFAITSETASGFTITFYDSTGATISRKFNVFAKGFGRQQ